MHGILNYYRCRDSVSYSVLMYLQNLSCQEMKILLAKEIKTPT